MKRELYIPADALARIRMLFLAQQKAARTSSQQNNKDADTPTGRARNREAEGGSTSGLDSTGH